MLLEQYKMIVGLGLGYNTEEGFLLQMIGVLNEIPQVN